MSGCTDQLGLQGGGDQSWKSRSLSVEGLRASWGRGPWMPWAAPSDSPPYKQGPRGHVQQRTSGGPLWLGQLGTHSLPTQKGGLQTCLKQSWSLSCVQVAFIPAAGSRPSTQEAQRGGCRYSKPLSTHFSSNELVSKKGKTAARQEAGSAVQALTCSRSLGRGADKDTPTVPQAPSGALFPVSRYRATGLALRQGLCRHESRGSAASLPVGFPAVVSPGPRGPSEDCRPRGGGLPQLRHCEQIQSAWKQLCLAWFRGTRLSKVAGTHVTRGRAPAKATCGFHSGVGCLSPVHTSCSLMTGRVGPGARWEWGRTATWSLARAQPQACPELVRTEGWVQQEPGGSPSGDFLWQSRGREPSWRGRWDCGTTIMGPFVSLLGRLSWGAFPSTSTIFQSFEGQDRHPSLQAACCDLPPKSPCSFH
ncbi:uncharacterized protein LOC102901054 [Felis catus]|uniref:uncharacterized protein LOC102901054 n=1 Tax=Felis catus TaxID=9685 RepID=UPI000C2F92B1|nr:uncharacterized protein LOC102901054 [Felis catus]